jgi:hypothetical protein
VTAAKIANGRQPFGAGEEKRNAILCWSGMWEQPQRRTEPASGASGREPCR